MEAELVAQRDAALAVTHELQKQLQSQREVVERRALNAERLRSQAEERMRHLQQERVWEKQANRRQVHIVIICCVLGSLVGWTIGLFIALALHQPIMGFLAVIPGMASGIVVGLAIAKTRAEVEARRRDKVCISVCKCTCMHVRMKRCVHASRILNLHALDCRNTLHMPRSAAIATLTVRQKAQRMVHKVHF